MVTAQSKKELKAQRVEQLEATLFDIAMHSERDEARIMAATRLHAIYEGQPIARTISANVDDLSQLSDEQLKDDIARAARALGVAGQGGAGSGKPN